MRRKPYVAGYFYPADRSSLSAMLHEMTSCDREKKKAIAVIVPHAGYIYSGRVAGAVFSSVEIPRTIILVGPSHRPIRSRFAVYREGTWETPLGGVPVCRELADLILEKSELVQPDCKAHEMEHSLEVQLPFIQFFGRTVRSYLSAIPILLPSRNCKHWELSFQKLSANIRVRC
jgi:AmmeMemoRadiSam system protein B